MELKIELTVRELKQSVINGDNEMLVCLGRFQLCTHAFTASDWEKVICGSIYSGAQEARLPSVCDINVGVCWCMVQLGGKEQQEGKSERSWAGELWTCLN